MAKPRCPTCEEAVRLPADNPCFPFCSERCRAIDLGKWLGEEFRIPTRHVDEDEDGDSAMPRRPLDA